MVLEKGLDVFFVIGDDYLQVFWGPLFNEGSYWLNCVSFFAGFEKCPNFDQEISLETILQLVCLKEMVCLLPCWILLLLLSLAFFLSFSSLFFKVIELQRSLVDDWSFKNIRPLDDTSWSLRENRWFLLRLQQTFEYRDLWMTSL